MSLFISTHTIKNIVKHNEACTYDFTSHSMYITDNGDVLTESQCQSAYEDLQIITNNMNGLKENDKLWLIYDNNMPFAFSKDEGKTYNSFYNKVSLYQRYKIRKALKRKTGEFMLNEKFLFVTTPICIFTVALFSFIILFLPNAPVDINTLFNLILNTGGALVGSLSIRNFLKERKKTMRFLNEKEIMNIDQKINEEILLLPHTREIIYKSMNLKKQNIKN